MSDQAWTDDRVDRLKSLWNDGLSAAQVAKALGGVTRNAVIGKLYRLKLTGTRPATPRPRRATSPRRSRQPARLSRPRLAPPPSAPIVVTPEGPGLFCAFADLPPRCCKWPIGDPLGPDFSLCGCATDGGPYCPGHHRAAHQPRKAPPIAADPLVRRALAGERV